jgi:uncharacterized membrane protein
VKTPPRLAPLRHIHARPRLWSSLAFGIAVGVLLPGSLVEAGLTRALIGWNAGALLYLLLVFTMMHGATAETIRSHAQREDEGRYTILFMASVTMVVVLLAIAVQLSYAKESTGSAKFAHVGLAALTVFTAWLFVQTIFALHYAHEYQLQHSAKSPSLVFPGSETPDYYDFLYVSCIIGTSGQTADVAFASRRMRRVGLLHCVLAFVFNTTLLAFTINVAASMI